MCRKPVVRQHQQANTQPLASRTLGELIKDECSVEFQSFSQCSGSIIPVPLLVLDLLRLYISGSRMKHNYLLYAVNCSVVFQTILSPTALLIVVIWQFRINHILL